MMGRAEDFGDIDAAFSAYRGYAASVEGAGQLETGKPILTPKVNHRVKTIREAGDASIYETDDYRPVSQRRRLQNQR